MQTRIMAVLAASALLAGCYTDEERVAVSETLPVESTPYTGQACHYHEPEPGKGFLECFEVHYIPPGD